MPSRLILVTWGDEKSSSCEEIIVAKVIQSAHYLEESLKVGVPTEVTVTQMDTPEDWSAHFVLFDENGWAIEHSLECRINGNMRDCTPTHYVQWVTGEYSVDSLFGRWKIVAGETPYGLGLEAL